MNAPFAATASGQATPHDSAERHVRGTAPYIDDIPEPAGCLHIAPGTVDAAAGTVTALDLSAVRAAPGVADVLTEADIPGDNDASPGPGDEPIFTSKIAFHGQSVFAVVAETRDAARRAARLVRAEVAPETPILDIDAAVAAGAELMAPFEIRQGDPQATRLTHSFKIGGQEHFYLEAQAALAIPEEDGMTVHTSTQHPTEVQHKVAACLGLADAQVTAITRRMGGGFGGKESQATIWACVAALAAHRTGRPCKIVLDRDDDMAMTGKRHDFRVDLAADHDDAGTVTAVQIDLAGRCGATADLSLPVNDRAALHADNAYRYPACRITSRRYRTNTCSNTAFRGFGGPQGMVAAERLMDAIAIATGRDPLDVRRANLYRNGDVTPYGMAVETPLADILDRLERTSDYRARAAEIAATNAASRWVKRGIALTPVKFGISFTKTELNQAGALVHLYTDGSIHLNHGGTEMGQGLYQKVAAIAADAFGTGLDRVHITAARTDKVPNTSPTAASSGTDLNGAAVAEACRQITARMAEHLATERGLDPATVRFSGGQVQLGPDRISLRDAAKLCYMARVQLSAAGFYRTPKIHWDRANATGRPFYYFACGAACSEVEVDTATGENRVTRVDLLHDVGRSLNPAIDLGQVEGGFVQGMGWLTTEELCWTPEGRLATHAPSTYKIPTAFDVPEDFRVTLLQNDNPEATVYRSKAVGEPPLMLAISVFSALTHAVASIRPGTVPPLDAPATPEALLMAAEALR